MLMKTHNYSHLQKITRAILLAAFSGLFSMSVLAQQADRPFSIQLNAGGGLIGNSTTSAVFQPELGISYMPGRWGIGLESGFFSFDPSFNADEYRIGFEEYTMVQATSDKWNSFYINAGPRFRFGEQLPVQFSAGLDVAFSYKNPPVQSVEFNDPEGEFGDAQFTLANVEPEEGYSKWSAAFRPQLQLEFNPFRSNRIGFNLKTGIQYELSDRDFTYTERDLSRVQLVPSAGEMLFQFENAREVERSVTAPKTNFFANAGIKISFGRSRSSGSGTRSYFEGDQQRTAAVSPNDGEGNAVDEVPATIAHQGRIQGESHQGETDDIGINDHIDLIDDAIETAKDYNTVRSNKRRGRWVSGDEEILLEAFRMARIVNPSGTVISAGQVITASTSENPLYEENTSESENPLYEDDDLAYDGDGDNTYEETYSPPIQRFDVQPSSYCVSLSNISDQALKSPEEEDRPVDRAADGYPGDILAVHACPIYGYRLLIIRPAGYPSNASERIIRVEKMNKFFHATWNEVSNLVNNYQPNQITYDKLPHNPGPSGERYCNRSGHMIPTDTDVYQVSLVHSNNYNGVTSVFADSNLELAPLSTVISAYNQRRDQGDALPSNCNYGCSGNSGGVVTNTNNWPDMNFGGLDFDDKDPRKPGTGTGVVNVDPGVDLDVNVDDGISAGLEPSYLVNLRPAVDELGFPLMMKNASFSMSKQSARAAQDYNTVRSNKRRSEISGDGDDVIDISDDVARFHFELEIDPINPDDDGYAVSDDRTANNESDDNNAPENQIKDTGTLLDSMQILVRVPKKAGEVVDSDTGGIDSRPALDTFSETGDTPAAFHFGALIESMVNKLDDVSASATYSISKRSARTGRSESHENPLAVESGRQETPNLEIRMPNNVYRWTYNLSSLTGNGDFPANGTLTVLFTGGKWHFDVELDPEDYGDETDELLQNSSFSIN